MSSAIAASQQVRPKGEGEMEWVDVLQAGWGSNMKEGWPLEGV